MSNCCVENNPDPGTFPPERPIRRQRYWTRVLAESAMLRATQTRNRYNPRMVKRRNSRYAPHDRAAKKRVPVDYTPGPVAPEVRNQTDVRIAARAKRSNGATAKRWTPDQPGGRFCD